MDKVIREGFDEVLCELDLEGHVKAGLAEEKKYYHQRVHLVRLPQHAE